jgi:hypothetical protein
MMGNEPDGRGLDGHLRCMLLVPTGGEQGADRDDAQSWCVGLGDEEDVREGSRRRWCNS